MGALGRVGLLNGSFSEAAFEHLPAVDLLFHSAAGDEAVHNHMPPLPDAESSVNTLTVDCTCTQPFRAWIHTGGGNGRDESFPAAVQLVGTIHNCWGKLLG